MGYGSTNQMMLTPLVMLTTVKILRLSVIGQEETVGYVAGKVRLPAAIRPSTFELRPRPVRAVPPEANVRCLCHLFKFKSELFGTSPRLIDFHVWVFQLGHYNQLDRVCRFNSTP